MDKINPNYYKGDVECIDAIKAELSTEEYQGFLRGTITKCLWRYRKKGGAEDLEKTKWYLDKLIAATPGGRGEQEKKRPITLRQLLARVPGKKTAVQLVEADTLFDIFSGDCANAPFMDYMDWYVIDVHPEYKSVTVGEPTLEEPVLVIMISTYPLIAPGEHKYVLAKITK